jgi:hypothetical protein
VTSVEAVFRILNRARVRYLLIGGYASVVHGIPRTTVDVDLALDPDPENVGRATRSLRRLGLEPETDRVDEILGHGGVTARNDRAVDLLTSLPGGIRFTQLWPRKAIVRFRGVRIPVVSRRDQIRLLRAAGRPQDLEDARALEESE